MRTGATTRRAACAALLPMWLAAALLAPPSLAATAGPEGLWQGTLQGMLRLVVHIDRAPGGGLTGTMDSPDQGAMGLAIDTLSFTGDSLRFEMRRIMAGFAGRLTAAGDSIDGVWRQGGMALPLGLKHVEQVVVPRRPQEPQKPYPYREDTVRVENRAGGVSLAGTLTTPAGAGPFPCAVLVTGSGPEDRDETIFGHRPFWVLADHLTRKGIAVLRLDDRGVGGSSGRFSRATSEDFASDILSAVSFLEKYPGIDPKRIGLIGHSEGGLIAPMVATRSKSVAFIVMMAGPGIPGDSIMILQGAALRRLSGASEAVVARESAAMRRIHALLRAGADSAAIVPAVRELIRSQLSGLPDEQRRAAGDLDGMVGGATRQFISPWFRFFVAYDPRPTLRRVKCPVLALNGDKDFQVPAREDLAAIQATLEAGGNRDVTVKQLAGLNHLFQTAGTGSITEYGSIEETLSPVALATISDWIVEHTIAKR